VGSMGAWSGWGWGLGCIMGTLGSGVISTQKKKSKEGPKKQSFKKNKNFPRFLFWGGEWGWDGGCLLTRSHVRSIVE